jgi:hypothetical protein
VLYYKEHPTNRSPGRRDTQAHLAKVSLQRLSSSPQRWNVQQRTTEYEQHKNKTTPFLLLITANHTVNI